MFKDYRPAMFYWESVVTVRKLAVVLVTVFVSPYGQGLTILLALGVLLMATWAQLNFLPHKPSEQPAKEVQVGA